MFVLAVVGRRAGKSYGASRIAGHRVLETCDEVPWVSPTDPIGKRIREKITRPMWQNVITKAGTVASPTPTLRFVGGGTITYHSTHNKYTKEGGGKGLGILGGGFPLMVLDEGARMPWGLIEEEVIPTIGDTGGKLLIPTTPKGKRNWIYQKIYLRALEGDPRYRVVHGPSTLNPNPKILRFVEWAKRDMDPLTFRQEILAEFIEGQGAVFRNILENAVLSSWFPKPFQGGHYVIGCDVAKHQDFTVLMAIETRTGEFHGFDRFNNLSWPLIEDRIWAFWDRWGRPDLWIDSTGVGDPVYDHLESRGMTVVPTKFTNESKSNLVQALAMSMDQQEISYPNDELLVAELDAFDYEILPSGRFRYGAPDQFHDDIVIAMALAVYGRNQAFTGVPI